MLPGRPSHPQQRAVAARGLQPYSRRWTSHPSSGRLSRSRAPPVAAAAVVYLLRRLRRLLTRPHRLPKRHRRATRIGSHRERVRRSTRRPLRPVRRRLPVLCLLRNHLLCLREVPAPRVRLAIRVVDVHLLLLQMVVTLVLVISEAPVLFLALV